MSSAPYEHWQHDVMERNLKKMQGQQNKIRNRHQWEVLGAIGLGALAVHEARQVNRTPEEQHEANDGIRRVARGLVGWLGGFVILSMTLSNMPLYAVLVFAALYVGLLVLLRPQPLRPYVPCDDGHREERAQNALQHASDLTIRAQLAAEHRQHALDLIAAQEAAKAAGDPRWYEAQPASHSSISSPTEGS